MSKEKIIISILQDYDKNINLFRNFNKELDTLIKRLLEAKNIKYHLISPRPDDGIKKRKSLENKLSSPEKNYSNIHDIKDICALRIITYFDDDVDKVAKVIENEFKIDLDNSIDKRRGHNTNSFGYLSLHYVCFLSDKRSKLTEYKEYKLIPFEIQIRSILQHSWAEIEHDLGYKNKKNLSPRLERTFSRIASLLESADNEFTTIRKTLSIEKTETPLNVDNLIEYVKNSKVVKQIDNKILKNCKKIQNFEIKYEDKPANFTDETPILHYIHFFSYDENINIFSFFEIDTIEKLHNKLTTYADKIAEFYPVIIEYERRFGFELEKKNESRRFFKGFCIQILTNVLLFNENELKTVTLQYVHEFFRRRIIKYNNPFEDSNKKSSDKAARDLFNAYYKVFPNKKI